MGVIRRSVGRPGCMLTRSTQREKPGLTMRLSHRIVLLLVWASFSVSWAQRGKRVPEHLRPGDEGGIGSYRRQSLEQKCERILNRVETCYEDNSAADDITSATTRCFFGFDRLETFDVNCTALESDSGSRMPRLNRRFRGGRRNRAFNRFERRANNRKRKFAESMCELAAELDNGDNEEDEEAAAADCIEDIPDVTGYRMTRDEAEQAAEWSRQHFNASGATGDECEENIDTIVVEYVNGTDYLAPCHAKSVGKCFMEMKMALCTELTTEEAGDGELGVEEYRDIIACTIGMECT